MVKGSGRDRKKKKERNHGYSNMVPIDKRVIMLDKFAISTSPFGE